MANFSTIQVRASKEVIDSMVTLVGGEYEVDFNLIAPMPEGIYGGERTHDAEALHGKNAWWYWRSANWGVNRNAFNTERKSDTSIYFETCWGVPEEALVALSQKFPDEEINVRTAGEQVHYFAEGYILKNGDKTLDPTAPRTKSVYPDVDQKEHARWMRWNRKVANRKFA